MMSNSHRQSRRSRHIASASTTAKKVVIGGGLLSIVVCAVFVVRFTVSSNRYAKTQQRLVGTIDSLERRIPSGEDPDRWSQRIGLLHNAAYNLHWPGTGPRPDHKKLERLREEIELRAREEVTWETTDWLWQRLSEFPNGKRYLATYEEFSTKSIRDKQEFLDARTRLTSAVRALERQCPLDIDSDAWTEAVAWTARAAGRPSFRAGKTDYRPLADLADRFDARKKDSVEWQTLIWLWEKLEEFPESNSYMKYFSDRSPQAIRDRGEQNETQ